MTSSGKQETTADDRPRLLDRLKAEVRRLEGDGAQVSALLRQSSTRVPREAEPSVDPSGRRPPPPTDGSASTLSVAGVAGWTLGEASFDRRLPEGCLNSSSLIELKPGDYGDWPAALSFAACLAVRRRLCATDTRHGRKPLLWCSTAAFSADHGHLHGPGLVYLGLSPEALIAVEVRRDADALWALEEALRSRALLLAIGVLGEVKLTPARRLSLAAAAGGTPALLVTAPASNPVPSADIRLRLGRLPSAPHPMVAKAVGAPRFRLTLERCRRAPLAVDTVSFDLEWCDVTSRFHMVPGLGDRSFATPVSGERAFG